MKRFALRAVSAALLLLSAAAIYCGITVTGGGFLDLSNLVRWISFAIAALGGVLAAVIWHKGNRRK